MENYRLCYECKGTGILWECGADYDLRYEEPLVLDEMVYCHICAGYGIIKDEVGGMRRQCDD